MGSPPPNKLRYVTDFNDRHKRRWYYFRYRGQKFKLPGEPRSSEFNGGLCALSRGRRKRFSRSRR